MTKFKGLSLLELMFSLSLLSVLLTIAVPSYQQLIEQRRLRGAAETLAAELQFAKLEAIKTNTTIKVDFTVNNAQTWCYAVSTTQCNCQQSHACQLNGVERVVQSAAFPNIAINQTQPWNGTATFNPSHGTMNAGGATLYSEHFKIRVTSSDFGRIKICNPSDLSNKSDFSGYPKCN